MADLHVSQVPHYADVQEENAEERHQCGKRYVEISSEGFQWEPWKMIKETKTCNI